MSKPGHGACKPFDVAIRGQRLPAHVREEFGLGVGLAGGEAGGVLQDRGERQDDGGIEDRHAAADAALLSLRAAARGHVTRVWAT